MYKVHHDATRMTVSFKNEEYELNGKTLPAISISASKDSLGRIHISAVNIDAKKPRPVRIKLDEEKRAAKGRVLSSASLQDHNSFNEPDKITPKEFKDFKIANGSVEFTLPPFSVVVLELK
jgi:alpha-N-arabinofuranosidase